MSEGRLINDSVIFWQDPVWISSLTGLAALVFSFYSIYQQKKMVVLQIKFSLKEKWVNDLKENLAQFLNYSMQANELFLEGMSLYRLAVSGKLTTAQLEDERKVYESFQTFNFKSYELISKISLFLNEGNKVHCALIKELTAWSNNSHMLEKAVKSGISEEAEKIFRDKSRQIQKNICKAAHAIISDELKDIF